MKGLLLGTKPTPGSMDSDDCGRGPCLVRLRCRPRCQRAIRRTRGWRVRSALVNAYDRFAAGAARRTL